MHQLLDKIKIVQVVAPTVAGTSDVTGATIDMQGYSGVIFVGRFGTAAANNFVQIEQGEQANMSDAATLASSKLASGTSDENVAEEIFQPQDRYIRPIFKRGTSSTLDICYAILFGSRVEPRSSDLSGTIVTKSLTAPAEGTP
ncbi:MAG: hypothetical protein IT435_05590 [Phycisphaerales bacterium]|nr:hypothetical protein [Phycisphaerales bacterium]